jgi:hypothetical protein
MQDAMNIAIAKLETHRWGRFFFALPVYKSASNAVVGCDVMQSTESRVIIPDSALTLAEPLYGDSNWMKFGTIGSLDYPGQLIPLHVVATINPEFDFLKVLRHGVRRQEYEGGVNEHLEFQRNLEAVS